MGEVSLSGEWLASWTDGLHGRIGHAIHKIEDPQRYLLMHFPGSIQSNLLSAGIIDDPRLDLNSLKARWVEEHFWIIRKTFIVPSEAVEQSPRLHLDICDGNAQIYLNGIEIGANSNANFPVDISLNYVLRPGENELVIVLESGLFKVAELPGMMYSIGEETLLNKRQHLRQAQYQFGWDWNPHIIYLGLHGEIRISWGEFPRLKQVVVLAEVEPDLKSAKITVRPCWFMQSQEPITINLHLSSRDGLETYEDVILSPGKDHAELGLTISDPKIWWPRGHGSQELYPLELMISSGNQVVERWISRTGLRRIEIQQPPHPETGNYFRVVVNNRPIFCKGSNWVPPELSPHEVSLEKLEKLIELGIEQNFNLFRIWGGGVWAGHDFLDLCDEAGIMVWHDLLFACSKYPVDRPDFLANVIKEIEWGMSEFSPHPSLLIWCGNNELEEGLWSWNYKDYGVTAPDYVLFHQIVPTLLRRIDPTRPYWPSSPYSSPEHEPQDPTRGDQHPWSVSLHPDIQAADFWRYRQFYDRFPNEGGVLGITPLASLKQFLSEDYCYPRSFAWEHHDNSVSFWQPRIGISYLMVENWIGKPALDLSFNDLVLSSGLIQMEGLKEYIRNYRRRWPSTSSAIYWDYTDSWPSVHGWGTLDYFLRRKPSFYSVRRSNKPVIVVLADEIDFIGVYLVNDTMDQVVVMLEAGSFSVKGSRTVIEENFHSLLPFTSTRISTLPRDMNRIAYAILRDDKGSLVDWDRILFKRAFEWRLVEPEITSFEYESSFGRFERYQSDDWVWNVIINPDGEQPLEDDFFDLFPGIPYDVPLRDGENLRGFHTSGNHIIIRNRKI